MTRLTAWPIAAVVLGALTTLEVQAQHAWGQGHQAR